MEFINEVSSLNAEVRGPGELLNCAPVFNSGFVITVMCWED